MAKDDFTSKVRRELAMRAGFECSNCGAGTVGRSAESASSVTDIGVAAHISGARIGSARHDEDMKSEQRSSIENAIWLCQNHAKAIDDDAATWTRARLVEVKDAHEEDVSRRVGVPKKRTIHLAPAKVPSQEYAFLKVREMLPAYRQFLAAMLVDRGLGNDAELGVFMTHLGGGSSELVPWSVFVRPEWLRGAIAGKAEVGADGAIPNDVIYGRVPCWPDDFFEFLAAIVESRATLQWQRTPQGHLALAQ